MADDIDKLIDAALADGGKDDIDRLIDEATADEPMPDGSPPPRTRRPIADVATEEATDPLRLAGRLGGALYGPAAQSAMGGVQALKDLLTPGVRSGLGEEASGYLEALRGAFDSPRRIGATVAKTMLPVPLMPADVLAEGPAAYGNEVQQFGATLSSAGEGLLKTGIRGGVDPDRPTGSSGDIATLGAALSRVVGQSPTPKPSEFRGKLRDKATQLRAEDRIEKGLADRSGLTERIKEFKAEQSALKQQAATLKKQSRDARRSSPLTKEVDAAKQASKDAAQRLRDARRAGANDDIISELKRLKKDAKRAYKDAREERAAKTPGVQDKYARAKEIERYDIEDVKAREAPLRTARDELDVLLEADRGKVRRIGGELNDTFKGRLVDWLSTKKTVPFTSTEIPGLALGSPEALMAVEGVLRRASQSSQYIKNALGPALAAGSIEDALAVHDELMQSDSLYRQNFELLAE